MDTDAAYDVTVAIPTRDGGALLDRVLDGVFEQDTDRRVECIAADSGSTDGTLERLARRKVRVLEVPRHEFDWGKVRDRLYEEARGSVVVNLSQDAVPAHSRWLENLLAPLEGGEVGASCGTSVPDEERGEAQFAWERNGYFYFTREIQKFVARYGKGLSFANSAVPRKVWERLRIDPQPTGEDFQFQIKLHKAKLPIVFPTDAPVFHHHDYTFQGLYRRCRNEGLALREMGCPYTEADLLADLVSGKKYVQWLRELKRRSLTSMAAVAFPVLRPLAVYAGSRFGREYMWY